MADIPKIIHYCWVGGAQKPKSVELCIESWRKHCPDYEIIEWNESNYDFFSNGYMAQAYQARKWGFVPDYARLDIVFKYGGIYLDTDVEMLTSFDRLLENEAFMGFENTGDGEFFVNCGHGFGAVPQHPIIGAARDLYDSLSFVNADGSLNLLASPYYTTQTLKAFGLKQENRDQKLNGMMVYASDVLCPKTFRTGDLNITDRTVSIHHFTASWLDEKIKKELYHQQRIYHRFGEKGGHYILLAESVLEKYSLGELITKMPKRQLGKVKNEIIRQIELQAYKNGLKTVYRIPEGTSVPILFDTALNSDNLGDQIIMESCEHELSKSIDVSAMKHIPTHRFQTKKEKKDLINAKYKILCGTNILSGHMRQYGLWKLTPNISVLKNTVLMGVGFDSEDPSYDGYTKAFFEGILHSSYLHSVRDRFSELKLKRMGIKNVIYTGCPTMWRLQPDFCSTISPQKAEEVICTVTDYNRNPDKDKKMIETCLQLYNKVYCWPQGIHDEEYLISLGIADKIHMLPRTLQDYDDILKKKEVDYIGTRLHAGIHALSEGHRSIIIAIDNRARCISKDTGLPIIERQDVEASLQKKIESDITIHLTLPWESIERWKEQFK